MTKYIVIENTPGYLPDSDPNEFDNLDEARDFMDELINELLDMSYRIVTKLEDYAYLEKNASDLGRVIEILEEKS